MPDVKTIREILTPLEDDDWFEGSTGQIFEWGYDVDNNIRRWFPLSFIRDAPPAFQREKALTHPGLEFYGLGTETVYKWDRKADSYRPVEAEQ